MIKKHSYLFSFFYDIAMCFMVIFYLPKMVKKTFKGQLPSNYFKNRLGFGLSSIKKNFKGAIWFHAVSLGEMKALAPLVTALKKEFPTTKFLFSTSTMTGYQEAKKTYPQDGIFFLPVDFSFIMRSLIKAINPKCIIFSETDLWFNLLRFQHGHTIVVSAKLSENSMKNYKRFPLYARHLFPYIDRFLCQNTLYEKRFLEAGVPESKLEVTGNLKYDIVYPYRSEDEIKKFKEQLGIEKCIVIGSTHPKEEEDLLDALLPLNQTLVLVPRHPSRFHEVKLLLERKEISFYQMSEKEKRPDTFQVILIDAMGLLMQFYEIATVAIIAGSYQPIGGHNILEPLAFGTPVLFGPHMHTQFELVDLVLQAKAGMQVPLNRLKETVDQLTSHPDQLKEMGENGKHLIESLQGVTKKTIDRIHALTLKNS